MKVIEHDFSDFLHTYNLQNLPILAKKEVLVNEEINEEAIGRPDKQMSLTLFFLAVTIILIAILVLIFLLNKTSNPTKQVIDKHKKSHGKS